MPVGVLDTTVTFDPLASDQYKIEALTHAIKVAVVKHIVAAYSLGKGLSAHLRDLVGYRQNDR